MKARYLLQDGRRLGQALTGPNPGIVIAVGTAAVFMLLFLTRPKKRRN